MAAEEGRTHAEVHPGSEHHHALMCFMGSGRGHRVHRPRSEYQHGRQQPSQSARAFQNAERVREDGVQESWWVIFTHLYLWICQCLSLVVNAKLEEIWLLYVFSTHLPPFLALLTLQLISLVQTNQRFSSSCANVCKPFKFCIPQTLKKHHQKPYTYMTFYLHSTWNRHPHPHTWVDN